MKSVTLQQMEDLRKSTAKIFPMMEWSDEARAASLEARRGGGEGKKEGGGTKEAGEKSETSSGGTGSLGNLKGLTSYEDDDDDLSTPGSFVEVEGDTVQIHSDNGDESAYGDETWEKDGGDMVLKSSYGRDTFDDNFADRYHQEKSGTYESASPGLRVPMKDFVAGVKAHVKFWRARRDEMFEGE